MSTTISGDTGVSAVQNNTITSAKIVDGAVAFADLLATDWTATIGSNGSQKLPSGLIIQWGTTAANTGSISTNFATTFPTACFAVLITAITPGGAGQTHDVVSAKSTTAFTLQNSSGVSSAFYYIAIGN